MLPEFDCRQLRRIDITITGDWIEGPRRSWEGLAVASEPIVAVSFCVSGNQALWCKSQPGKPDGQPVRFGLGEFDDIGCEVNVNFRIGQGGIRSWPTKVASSTYRPEIKRSISASTCNLVPFTTIHGYYTYDLVMLFLAASDTKVGRKRLWRLRPHLVDSVPLPYRKLLTRRRNGVFSAAHRCVDKSS
jgi:hypothetical protein